MTPTSGVAYPPPRIDLGEARKALDSQIALLFALTFVIHLIGSLAYSVRIAGVRTRRIAVSLSLFNVLLLVSRTANAFQAPMLARRVESDLASGVPPSPGDFRWLIASASVATIAGAFLTPSFQRAFTRASEGLAAHRSLGRLLLRTMRPSTLAAARHSLALPALGNLATLARRPRPPLSILAIHAFATAVWTVGVLAALYAGYRDPALRATSSNLSGIVNGVATILLFVIVDPHVGVLTDEVMEGKSTEAFFRRHVVWMLGSRLAGTVLAQALFVPASALIAGVAGRL